MKPTYRASQLKQIWDELCTEFDNLRVVEEIPLLEPVPEGWHETLLAKIFEYNKWARKVAKAKAQVDFQWHEDVPAETREKRKHDHQSSLKVNQGMEGLQVCPQSCFE